MRYTRRAPDDIVAHIAPGFGPLGGAAAQKKYDPGASDTEIRIGNTNPYSGPASAYGTIGKVHTAYFKMINDQGGINGRKINLVSLDDGYSPPKAVEMVKITRDHEGIEPSHGLRIAVRGGGCSGFEYALDFESETRDNDWVYEQSGLTIYIDAVSARYLQGTNIDYVLGTAGAGFKFNNPNERDRCGCGESFRI